MTVRKAPLFLVAVAMASFAVPTARADIHLSVRDGRVVLVATNATIADIMAEWAKVGHTTIINADKIPRDVVTLELRTSASARCSTFSSARRAASSSRC